MTWLLIERGRRPLDLRWCGTSHRRHVFLSAAALLLLGAACGGIVLALDRVRIFDEGFVVAARRPAETVLVVVVVVLALLNSVAEEILWREVFDRMISDSTASPYRYALQVVSFGLAHWSGIPSGPVGVLTSGAFSGLMYFVRSRVGLLGSILVHFAADLIIFWFVARFAVFAWTGFEVNVSLR